MSICVICYQFPPINHHFFFFVFYPFKTRNSWLRRNPGAFNRLNASASSEILHGIWAFGVPQLFRYSAVATSPTQKPGLGKSWTRLTEKGKQFIMMRMTIIIRIINIVNIGMMVGITITDDNNGGDHYDDDKTDKKNNDDANHRISWWWWWWVAPSQSEFNDIESMTDNDKTFHSRRTHSAFFTVMFSRPSKSKSACWANRAKPLCALWSLW